MREIKTESQTLDLSKKVTLEVSLAELIVLSAAAYGVTPSSLLERLERGWKSDFSNLRSSVTMELEIVEEINEILASHGVKEDE
ncbi:hypothetical protein ACQRCG_04985 [Bacillus altitudinis]|uniref:hypothetical protein n=1 Tax=Bacillus altitudinis TaxID=293387 RepID=UPI003D060347